MLHGSTSYFDNDTTYFSESKREIPAALKSIQNFADVISLFQINDLVTYGNVCLSIAFHTLIYVINAAKQLST